MRLNKKIDTWVEKKFISEDQKLQILEFEKNNSSSLGIYTIITLGIVVIGIGLISLIASNWEEIPDFIKLILDFSILLGLGAGIYFSESQNLPRWKDSLIIAFVIAILASIGLISQIFHTGGELYQALGFWCFISLPIVLFSESKFPSHFWLISLLYTLGFYLQTNSNFFSLKEIVGVFTLVVPSTFILIGSLILRTGDLGLRQFGSSVVFYSILNFMLGTLTLLTLYKNSNHNDFMLYIYLPFIISSLAYAGILYFTEKKKEMIIYSLGILLYGYYSYSLLFRNPERSTLAILFILIWFSIAFLFHSFDYPRMFEFSIIVIGLRFLVIYFEIMESLAFTGVGLIFSGILIVGISVLYLKNRERIFLNLRRLL